MKMIIKWVLMLRISSFPKLMISLDSRKEFKRSSAPIPASSFPPHFCAPFYDRKRGGLLAISHIHGQKWLHDNQVSLQSALRDSVMRHIISSDPKSYSIASVSVTLQISHSPCHMSLWALYHGPNNFFILHDLSLFYPPFSRDCLYFPSQ